MIRLATMSSVCPDWNLEEIIAGMTRHGCEGLEPASSGARLQDRGGPVGRREEGDPTADGR